MQRKMYVEYVTEMVHSPLAFHTLHGAALTFTMIYTGTSCLSGCDRKPFSNATRDICGVCKGNGNILFFRFSSSPFSFLSHSHFFLVCLFPPIRNELLERM